MEKRTQGYACLSLSVDLARNLSNDPKALIGVSKVALIIGPLYFDIPEELQAYILWMIHEM